MSKSLSKRPDFLSNSQTPLIIGLEKVNKQLIQEVERLQKLNQLFKQPSSCEQNLISDKREHLVIAPELSPRSSYNVE